MRTSTNCPQKGLFRHLQAKTVIDLALVLLLPFKCTQYGAIYSIQGVFVTTQRLLQQWESYKVAGLEYCFTVPSLILNKVLSYPV